MKTKKILFWVFTSISSGLYIYLTIVSSSIGYQLHSLILTILITLYLLIFTEKLHEAVSIKATVFLSTILAFVLFFAPLKRYSDPTAYTTWGRVSVLGKLNPYRYSYIQFTGDPEYHYLKDSGFSKYTAIYSPLFVRLSEGITILSGGSFNLSIQLFKTLFLSSFILSVVVFWKLTKSKTGLYLYSLNPIVLNDLVKESHAEILVILAVVVSLYLLKKGRNSLSFAAIILAGLIKISYVIFVPLFFLYNIKVRNNRLKTFFCMAFILTVLYLVSYLPYLKNGDPFWMLTNHLINKSGTLYSANFLIYPLAIMFGGNFNKNYQVVGNVFKVLGIVAYLFVVVKTIFTKPDINSLVKHLSWVYLIYLFFILSFFMPYYAPMAIFLLSLNIAFNKEDKLFRLVLLISLYTSFYYQLLA